MSGQRTQRAGAVGDIVTEVFVQEDGVGFDARLPFLPAMVNGDAAVEVYLLEVVVLGCVDGPGRRVGIKIVGVIARHAAQPAYRIGGKNVLVGNAAHGFKVVAILQLASGNVDTVARLVCGGNGWTADGVDRIRDPRSVLLYKFVGDLIAREFMADNQGETVFLG